MDVYMELGRLHQEHNVSSLGHPINVCVGKDWYRFPSSFFLPSNENWRLQFVQSEFKGQLPRPYEPGGVVATRAIPPAMNDLNLEEPSRYVDISRCHLLIDVSGNAETAALEPDYAQDIDGWETVVSFPFLDKNSASLFRAFYVPFLTESRCRYLRYNLLKSKRNQFDVKL